MSSKFSDLAQRKTSEAPRELEPLITGPNRLAEVDSLSQKLKRGDAKQLKAIVSTDLHKRIKMASVTLERDISEITTEALEAWLKGLKEL